MFFLLAVFVTSRSALCFTRLLLRSDESESGSRLTYRRHDRLLPDPPCHGSCRHGAARQRHNDSGNGPVVPRVRLFC